MKELFERVIELDKEINEAFENNDVDKEYALYEEQCEVLLEIERLGAREEFDEFIESM